MTTEYEAKFKIKNKDEFRKLLKAKGAKLVEPERLMRRALTGEDFLKGKWLRLRDEGDKVTLTFKDRSELSATGTKEVEVEVNDFDRTLEILELSKLPIVAYQENKRESWELNGAQIEIDTWPEMKPYIEIEAESEQQIFAVAKKLGFSKEQAFHDPADTIYARENKISQQEALKVFENLRFE